MNEEQLEDLQTWTRVEKRFTSFENNFDLNLSKELFGDVGERLYLHFGYNCKCSFKIFKTYLTSEQFNILLDFIMTHPKFSG